MLSDSKKIMQSLRGLCQQYSKWKPLEDYILRIEAYKDSEGVLVLENCKAMIESVCKTILDDLAEPYSTSESIQALIYKTCNKMSCLPNTGELARSFITVAQRLGEFRNTFASIGHGQPVHLLEENKEKIIGASVSFLINSIEQLAIFLVIVYQEEYPQQIQAEIRYIDNTDFNEEFDDSLEPIQIGQYGPYSPSEVLFSVDLDAYKTELFSRKSQP